MTHDSTAETLTHIGLVREHMTDVVVNMMHRMLVHDQSKLRSPEKEAFDEISVRLRDTEYGSEEYRATLREHKPAIEHHQKANRHHPEFYLGGIRGMTLIDLIEMLCDWMAASKRMQGGGDIRKSIEYNAERFTYSAELEQILLNTVQWFELPSVERAITA